MPDYVPPETKAHPRRAPSKQFHLDRVQIRHAITNGLYGKNPTLPGKKK